jgi:hypothetical protein
MPFYFPNPAQPTFDALLRSVVQDNGLATTDLLTADDFQQACEQLDVHFADQDDSVWTPLLTLWTFLWQVLSPAKSCVAAVARALVWRIASGLDPCSANTGAYCKARRKLPEPLISGLTLLVGDRLEQDVPDAWLWHGHHVHLIDGNVITAADTPANQAVYPQRAGQPGGVGFPLVRWVALLSWATGAVTAAALGPYQGKQSGETSLARTLLQRLPAGAILLGDRLFATYWLLALTLARQAQGVFRLHAHRQRDGNGKSSCLERCLGHQDQLLLWRRPARPEWMDEATYQQMPGQLQVRICWHRVAIPGFRTQEVTLVTTLVDAAVYPVEELVSLYRQRWHAELDLRSLKGLLRMEQLVCKTPEMVRKELWMHLLGYNLIRQVQVQAARCQGVLPRQLSFAGTLQTVTAMRELLTWLEGPQRQGVVQALWIAVSQHRVADRPNRVEPRRVKRAPKPYRRLRQSRAAARQALLSGTVGE